MELTRIRGHRISWEIRSSRYRDHEHLIRASFAIRWSNSRDGLASEDLSRELEPSAQAIGNWVSWAVLEEDLRADGLTRREREELRRIKRENRQLRQEREILAIGEEGQRIIKRIIRPTNAWFARVLQTLPQDG